MKESKTLRGNSSPEKMVLIDKKIAQGVTEDSPLAEDGASDLCAEPTGIRASPNDFASSRMTQFVPGNIIAKGTDLSTKIGTIHGTSGSPPRLTRPRLKGAFNKWKFAPLRATKRDVKSSAKGTNCSSNRNLEELPSRRDGPGQIFKDMQVFNSQQPTPAMVGTQPMIEARSPPRVHLTKPSAGSQVWEPTDILTDLEFMKCTVVDQEKAIGKYRTRVKRAREYRVEAKTVNLKADDVLEIDGPQGDPFTRKENVSGSQERQLLSRVSKTRENRYDKTEFEDVADETKSSDPDATFRTSSCGPCIDEGHSGVSLDTAVTHYIHQDDAGRCLGAIYVFSTQDASTPEAAEETKSEGHQDYQDQKKYQRGKRTEKIDFQKYEKDSRNIAESYPMSFLEDIESVLGGVDNCGAHCHANGCLVLEEPIPHEIVCEGKKGGEGNGMDPVVKNDTAISNFWELFTVAVTSL